eukprot:2045299-Pyramimonas_sp.AAC.1
MRATSPNLMRATSPNLTEVSRWRVAQGKYISNVWKVEAGIGTGLKAGVNPSSGWVRFAVKP